MLEGKCPKCRAEYFGWALRSPRNQMCVKCNVALEITDEHGESFTGFSLSTAEEYKVISPQNAPSKKDVKPQ